LVSMDTAVTGVGEKEQAKKTMAERARIFKCLAGMTTVDVVVVVVYKERGSKRAGGWSERLERKAGDEMRKRADVNERLYNSTGRRENDDCARPLPRHFK
jgi:hypothetical protein